MKGIIKTVLIALGVIVGVIVLALVIGFIATSGEYSVPATAADDDSIPTVTLNGATFHSETYGSPADPTIIVVHGGPGADYRALLSLQDLADEYYVVFYDQRGSGLSPRVDDPTSLTFDLYLDDLDAFVDQYGAGEPVILIGHSFGGMMLAPYLAQHPEKVSHLVMAEPGPLTQAMLDQGPDFSGTSREAMSAQLRATFESFHISTPPDDKAPFDYVTGQVMANANPGYWCGGVPPASVEGWRFSYDAFQNVTASMYDANGSLISLVDGLDAIEMPPVLFMAGACNTIIGEDFQRQQMTYFPGSELVVIADSGHELFAEQPAASVDAVRAFLGE